MDDSILAAEEEFERSRTEKHNSEHYIFHYKPGTLAEKEIKEIAQIQESAFSKICSVLGVHYPERINYYFTDSPSEIGSIFWGQSASCNGCAVPGANKIYAVYNESMKCIGEHEDTHLISYLLGAPESNFLVEGLAMYFHEYWWGVPNEEWAAYYKVKDPKISIEGLLDNDQLSKYGEAIVYPIAGAFTKFLIEAYGIIPYIELYKYDGNECIEVMKETYHLSLRDIERSFWVKMGSCSFNSARLTAMLEH